MPKYTLHYFPIGGRAEAPRLMFKLAGVEYTDNRIPFTEWQGVKSDCMYILLFYILWCLGDLFI